MISVATLYCDQPDMLRRQMVAWSALVERLGPRFEFVVVDDCSQQPASAILRGSGLPVRLGRLTKAVPWNLAAGRNLAVHLAAHETVLMLDLDHQLTFSGAVAALDTYLAPQTYVQPTMVDASDPTVRLGPHKHAQLFLRDDYQLLGGYDERWPGYEGDNLFVPRREAAWEKWEAQDYFTVAYHADGGSSRWPRSGRFNARTRRTKAFAEAMLRGPSEPGPMLQTPWVEVKL